jgi:hypothetical protein
MVKGYHGRDGLWPDETTTKLWAGRYKLANLALRLPRWVIGLDVDHYDDKTGGDTLYDLEEKLGYLLAGPTSTSREDGISGIRLFALPGDYVEANWPSQAGPDIEVITWYERYVIAAPSIHRSGREYEWMVEGMGWGGIPSPSDLPMLSEDWCEYLIGLAGSGQEKWDGKSYDGSAAQWLRDYGSGERCQYITNIAPRWRWAIRDNGSAHEAAKLAISQAIKAAAEGHTGINAALWDVRDAFISRVGERGAGERRRGEGKAVQEWRSLVAGAVAKYGGEVADEDTICDELEGF